jgi:hypothetical protein
MKLKNVNTTLLVFAGLLCLSLGFFATAEPNLSETKNVFLDSDQDGLTDSEERTYGTDVKNPDTDGDGYTDGAEVKAGYNPLVKAPGDKLSSSVKGESVSSSTNDSTNYGEEKQNITQEVAQKISILASQSDAEDQEIGMENIQQILDSIMNGESFKNELPEISEDDIKILSQKYGNLSKEKAQEKEKEDVINYCVAVLYIFTSNSPEPLTSSTDTLLVLNQVIKKVLSSFSNGNPEVINDLSESGEKINEQLKEVPVPEDMVETQIKALQYASYAQDLKNLIKLDPTDPLSNLSNYSKIETFVQSLNSFYEEIKSKLDEYEVDYNEVQEKLEDHGISGDIFGSEK